MRRLVSLVAACAVCVALSVVITTPVHADPSMHYTMHTDDKAPGGQVKFFPDGDVVKLCDIESDGKYVELDIWNVTKDPDVHEYGINDMHNDGRCTYAKAAYGQPYDMAEKHCFSFRIRLMHSDNTVVDGSKDWSRWRNYNNILNACPDVD